MKRSRGMTEQELKNVQKAIRSFNLYYSNSLKKGIEDSTSGIIDELIDVDRMSNKGYAKYSMKMLKGMSRQEIEEYMGDLTSAKHLLVAVTELPDFVEYAAGIALKGNREDLWFLYDKMQELSYKLLTSSQFRDIVHNEDVSMSDIVEKIIEVATTDLGVSGFAAWYKDVSSI